MSQRLILIDAVSSACWEKKGKKKKEREVARVFFLGLVAGHALLAVLHGIFTAVRCN
jgi:uncharacterized oligopeptide transporter (OPT) family protein